MRQTPLPIPVLAVRYATFALVATLCNLAAQRGVLAVHDGPLGLAAAIAAGTLVGLVVKYLADKWWIFRDRRTGLAAHSQQFGLYALMGVFTTLIFWGTESAFWFLWQSHAMREAGAVLGLTIGYTVKYQLDRRFVFAPDAREALA